MTLNLNLPLLKNYHIKIFEADTGNIFISKPAVNLNICC
jgi:hypothetical protein